MGDQSRELMFKSPGQEYALTLRMLGNGRLEAYCFSDQKKRLCHIRGKLRKKVWVNVGDVILLGLREYQDEKADVIMRYTPEEARALRKYNEIPDTTDIAVDDEGYVEQQDECAFEFDDDATAADVDIDDL